MIEKITTGFVIQSFDEETGKPISQTFVAGDQVDWENETGTTLDENLCSKKCHYFPFEMKQPEQMVNEGWVFNAPNPETGFSFAEKN